MEHLLNGIDDGITTFRELAQFMKDQAQEIEDLKDKLVLLQATHKNYLIDSTEVILKLNNQIKILEGKKNE